MARTLVKIKCNVIVLFCVAVSFQSHCESAKQNNNNVTTLNFKVSKTKIFFSKFPVKIDTSREPFLIHQLVRV